MSRGPEIPMALAFVAFLTLLILVRFGDWIVKALQAIGSSLGVPGASP